MKIATSEIEAAKSRLLEVVEQRVGLQRSGKEYRGLCPFHDERTPSFTVVPEKRFFQCFGCGAKGDAIDFVQQCDGLTFHEAVKAIVGSSINAAPYTAASPRASAKAVPDDEWQTIIPVPDDAPAPSDKFWAKRGGAG